MVATTDPICRYHYTVRSSLLRNRFSSATSCARRAGPSCGISRRKHQHWPYSTTNSTSSSKPKVCFSFWARDTAAHRVFIYSIWELTIYVLFHWPRLGLKGKQRIRAYDVYGWNMTLITNQTELLRQCHADCVVILEQVHITSIINILLVPFGYFLNDNQNNGQLIQSIRLETKSCRTS